ncbi:MAG TPA: acyl-CoA dehydrogenase family protein [Candidatus Marinimicrobia bacterium]|nr:acyl-CoA dehydrogenase [Candidatus Neomarinimicrobiota bacterium]HOU17741.1 acyl-CoA dehydrogenase family protein [Candidatus Neomarinimicrobiota bacterium]HQH56308.1 acyl-CoA dehydrogenase family protein [Candidatus Neomarinimicrobiota bacterium]HQK11849.1 acyl-CoA dehydrogenase family protein [Candidatus Neomarinimicrobiota bacterium]
MTQTGLDQETRTMILDTINSLKNELLTRERILELDDKSEFPLEIVKELLSERIGLQMVFIPEEFGGLGGGALDTYYVSVELAKICLGVATAFLAIHLGAEPILLFGTEEQKQKWLAKIVNEAAIVAYAVTEADAGSNLDAIKTKAEPMTDESGNIVSYRLNGSKQFISNGGYADFLTLLAKAPEGATFFIVDGKSAGLKRGKPEHKHGIRAANTSPLTLENVIVPTENIVGGIPGVGLKQANDVFSYTRLMVAAFGLGAGLSAMEKAIQFAKTRIQFGTPLIEKQGYTHKLLVPNVVRLTAAQAYIEEIAKRVDSGDTDILVEGSIAKYFATEAGNIAAEAAIQALGGYGYMHDYEVEKIKRDVRITMIYEGTSEIQQNIIYLYRWRTTVKSKGEFYQKMAQEMRTIAEQSNLESAKIVAQALELLNDLIMFAHNQKLTRQQHIQFLLSDVITWSEVAAALVRKTAEHLRDSAPDANQLRSVLRIFVAEMARLISNKGMEIILGSETVSDETKKEWIEKVKNLNVVRAEYNIITEMDKILF